MTLDRYLKMAYSSNSVLTLVALLLWLLLLAQAKPNLQTLVWKIWVCNNFNNHFLYRARFVIFGFAAHKHFKSCSLMRMFIMKHSKSLDNFKNQLSDEDIKSSATLMMLNDLSTLLNRLKGLNIEKMLDIGCGYGGLTKLVASYLSIPEVYGLDKDSERLKVAQKRVQVLKLDVEHGSPFPNDVFDLVTSFGVLEHLNYFDSFFQEAFRVLKAGGYILISIPNLASYVNRILLLFGYQPRDIEVSQKVVVGVAQTFYRRGSLPLKPIMHTRSITLRALKQLLEFYNFEVIAVRGGSPPLGNPSFKLLVKVLDLLTSWRPSLSRRIFVLARKSRTFTF